jgi:ADP-ribosylglycohydrolase
MAFCIITPFQLSPSESRDIGFTTRRALSEFEKTGNARAGSRDPKTAGNGSLMRLAPVAIRHHADRTRAIEVARRQSVTTHAAPACVDACAFFAGLLVDAMSGADRSALLSPQGFEGHPEIAAIAGGRYIGKKRGEIASSGYVVDTLEAALWCVHRATDFREAVLLAANLGDDADTVARGHWPISRRNLGRARNRCGLDRKVGLARSDSRPGHASLCAWGAATSAESTLGARH